MIDSASMVEWARIMWIPWSLTTMACFTCAVMILGKETMILRKYCSLHFDLLLLRFPGGSEALQMAFKLAFTAPLDPNAPEYQVGNTNAHAAILAYKRFEDALDNLPSPTAVICKTANRASAVLAAYKVICRIVDADRTLLKFVESCCTGRERKLLQRTAPALRTGTW